MFQCVHSIAIRSVTLNCLWSVGGFRVHSCQSGQTLSCSGTIWYHSKGRMSQSAGGPKFIIRARLKEFAIPPITDGLVIGREASIGTSALKKALNLLIPDNFELVSVGDTVIEDVLVKATLLRRLTRPRLIRFLEEQVKPFMNPQDILHLQLDMEIMVHSELE